MRIVADLHIHSPYARAVSKEMTLENLDYWAGLKGINVMGTGDFTHPAWVKEIRSKLEPAENGLYRLKGKNSDTRFMLTAEVSSIYSKGGKVRRIHNLIFAPSVEAVEKINAALGQRGNLKSDGRPILGLDAKELAKIVFEIDPNAAIVPAHCWTPWFSVFGSMSGFDSLEECFEEYAPKIFAVETGLSSDPAMNWRWSKLDNIGLISNSDSHSLTRIGREANVFDCELSFSGITSAIKSHDQKNFLFTIEFYPEEGKYHYDGHRVCGYSASPEETQKNGKICPVCRKPVTVGVMNRVAALADREPGAKHANSVPFKNLVPLDQIIAEAVGVGVSSKKVKSEYMTLLERGGTEFDVLGELPFEELKIIALPEIAEGIMRVREGRIAIEPGYDGEYGKVKIFGEKKERISAQNSLF
ncbi:MAG: endonuclease Q family protein [Patescibacteria group bacterium]